MSTEKNNSILTKEIRDLFNKIEEKILGGDYIYRGEPKCHKNVSSNLYRQYKKNIKSENFDIRVVQDEIVKEAGRYTNIKDKFDIMAELQHFGGKTNLIDFTKDYRIALFFACNRLPDQNGRLIFLKRNIKTEKYDFHEPHSPQNRVVAQKSIFIHPLKGKIKPPEEDVICIPLKIKPHILSYLSKCHAISTATIYNDLHGFITNRHAHESAYTMFFKGLTAQDRAIKEPDKKEKHLNDAIDCYDESIKLNPQFSEPYNNRGSAKNDLGDIRGALNDLNESIELDPQYAGAYCNRGKVRYSCGDLKEAIDDCDKAIKFNPQLSEAYITRGTSKKSLGNYQEAEDDLNEAIKLDPNSFQSYNNRGNLKTTLGDCRGAISDYNKAIKLNPELPSLYNNRGNAENKLGNCRAAITDFDKAIELDPQYANAYYNRGISKKRLDDQTAKKDFEQAISLAKTQGNTGLTELAQQELDELTKSENPPPKKD